MEGNLKSIGKIITEARNKKRWTRSKLASLSGIQRTQLNNIELGRDTQTSTLLRIAKALKITIKLK